MAFCPDSCKLTSLGPTTIIPLFAETKEGANKIKINAKAKITKYLFFIISMVNFCIYIIFDSYESS
jgi:hypothetical protein